jgi:hypothetical protein
MSHLVEDLCVAVLKGNFLFSLLISLSPELVLLRLPDGSHLSSLLGIVLCVHENWPGDVSNRGETVDTGSGEKEKTWESRTEKERERRNSTSTPMTEYRR